MEILLETRKEVFKILQLVCVSIIVRVIKSRRMRWAWHVTRMGEMTRGLAGKPEGKRPPGKPRRRWDDRLDNNIKMDLQKVGYGGMGWIKLAQDTNRWRARVNAVMNLRVL